MGDGKADGEKMKLGSEVEFQISGVRGQNSPRKKRDSQISGVRGQNLRFSSF